jgi:Fur family transcriptional regulator, iron response regulator
VVFGASQPPLVARSEQGYAGGCRITKCGKVASGNNNPEATLSSPAGTPVSGYERRLDACGIRPTAQRVRIAALLLSASQHLSAEQILAQLRSRGARVSKATVYNTLNLFAARGLIRQLSVDGSRAWFDSNVEPHYHFHDLSTGALTDIPVPAVTFAQFPPPPPGTEVAGIDLVIRLRRKM